VITSNTALAAAPGNVFLPARPAPREDSVANVTALVCMDREHLDDDPVGHLPPDLLEQLDAACVGPRLR